MNNDSKDIKTSIDAFKRKYFFSLLLKGLLISLGLILSIFLVINTLEYSFRFGSIIRGILLFSFIVIAVYSLIKYVLKPIYLLLNHGMADIEAAKRIGAFFPDVKDRLLNIIQLQQTHETDLVRASILQKSQSVSVVEFSEAVTYSENRKYLKYVYIPLIIIALCLVLSPSLFTSSTERIVKFNKEFVPQAPFTFDLSSENLLAFKNEDMPITLKLTGDAIPESAYLIDGSRKIKMQQLEAGVFSFTFKKIQQSKAIAFEAAGFNSETYPINVVNRPGLKGFNVFLKYPPYLNKKNETLNNIGNLQIHEGTNVKWQLKTLDAEEASINFSKSDQVSKFKGGENQLFEFEKNIKTADTYSILLNNKYSNNKEKIVYQLDVLPDENPKIDLDVYQDTTLYSYIALGGNISDDYGLRKLKLHYQINSKGKTKSIEIPINTAQTSQRYYYQWFVDSINIETGNSIKYWLQVWDNDGVNGSKSTSTGTFLFKVPSKNDIKKDIAQKTEKTEKSIDNRVEEAKALREKIQEAEKKLKGKKELTWQDQNLLKDILKKKEELNKAIEELKKQNEELNSKRKRFSEQDERVKEKVEQLQKLMDDLLDEETKKLYDELQKLLDEQNEMNDIQDVLDKMNKKENNLEKELERTLELFKRMKFDQEMDAAIEELKEQTNKQERLINETENNPGEEKENTSQKPNLGDEQKLNEKKTKKESSEELSKKQEDLEESFKELEEKIETLKEENQELKNPKSLPDTEEEQESIKENQKKSKESLDNNRRKQSRESQQKAKESMKKMAEKLEQMQSSMEMNMMQQNLDDLRDIVNNLIKLSFDQEDMMNEFGDVKQSDPRFVELSQKQLKLKDDAKIVEDSLLSLANRVFQIASFVTREVTAMNDHMDKSVEFIKERKKPKAISEQQFAMTSINNLALLLDDVLQQMQDAMSEAMGKPKPGGEGKEMSMSELQQQLNEQIEGLKKSGKSGREMSEELAKLAAQQEKIREALEGMQEKLGEGENGIKPGDGIPKKMEETESDLVNKNITSETIQRQKEILTRLLQAEEAMRERELDEERKGETAKEYENVLPRAFEEYFKMKEKEIELLKTVPPKLYPYYKKEVNDYFKRLEKGQNKQSE